MPARARKMYLVPGCSGDAVTSATLACVASLRQPPPSLAAFISSSHTQPAGSCGQGTHSIAARINTSHQV